MGRNTKILIVLLTLIVSIGLAATKTPVAVFSPQTKIDKITTEDNAVVELQATPHALPVGFKLPDRAQSSDVGSWYTYTRWESTFYYFNGVTQYYGLHYRTYDFGLSSPLTFEQIEFWTYLDGAELDSTVCLQIYAADATTLLWESGDFLVDTAFGGYTVYDMPDTTIDVGDDFYVMIKSRTAGYPCPILESDATGSVLPRRRNMVGGASMASLGLYGYSPCLTVQATAAAASFDLFEGFDGASFPPTGWTANIIGGTTNWVEKTTGDGYYSFINTYLMGDNTGTTPTPPPGMAMFDCYNADAGDEAILYSPQIATSATEYEGLNVRFYLFKSSSYSTLNDTLFIETSTDGGTSWTTRGFVTRYSASTGWVQYTIDCGIYPPSSLVNIGFRGKSAYGCELYIDHVMAWRYDVVADDVGVDAITIPSYNPILVGEKRGITAHLKNFGVATQTSFDVSYDPGDGSGVVTETWTGSLPLGETTSFTFADSWDCNTVGPLFEFKAWTELAGDEDMSNDTATTYVAVCPDPIVFIPPYFKNFDEPWGVFGDNPPFCGWTIVDMGDEATPTWNQNDWFHGTVGGLSGAAVSYSPTENQNEWLYTPTFDCSANGAYTLSFTHIFYSWGAYDTGEVYYSIDDGLIWTLLDGYYGDGVTIGPIDLGTKTFDVTSLISGQPTVKFAFNYRAYDSNYWIVDDFILDYTPVYTLVVTPTGNGSVTKDPDTTYYLEGTPVTLTAIPDPGYAFSAWSGDYIGTDNPTIVTMDANKDINATFLSSGWYQAESIPEATDIKPGKYCKEVAMTAAGTIMDDGEDIYAFPGNKSQMFYKYSGGVWTTNLAILPLGVKSTNLEKINKKKVSKGTALLWNGDNIIYSSKGNTNEFWWYYIAEDSWVQKAFVPVTKKYKDGTSMVMYGGMVYLLAGNQKPGENNFFVYDPAADTFPLAATSDAWTPLTGAPLTPNNKKWKDGSCIAEIDGIIYALKGKDKENFLWSYDPAGDTALGTPWTSLEAIPYEHPMLGKKTKVKDGLTTTTDGEVLYAIKGGGKQDFWMYTPGTPGVWTPLETIPRLHKKAVPKGGAITYANGKVWLIKGNKTLEFWYYLPGTPSPVARIVPSAITPAASEKTMTNLTFSFIANTFSKTVNYTVPAAGRVSLKLFDATGRLVKTIHDGYLSAGHYTSTVSNVASGVYFLRYEDATNRAEAKLIVE